jgi:hypothetical protein
MGDKVNRLDALAGLDGYRPLNGMQSLGFL